MNRVPARWYEDICSYVCITAVTVIAASVALCSVLFTIWMTHFLCRSLT